MTFRRNSLFLFIAFLACPFLSFGQDLIDSLAAYDSREETVLFWEFNADSRYNEIKQIGIQRSLDSTIFSTIGQAADPDQIQNTFKDETPPKRGSFYRLFILFTDGTFSFSAIFRGEISPFVIHNSNSERVDGDDFFQPSIFVYTNPGGDVNIDLPDVDRADYAVRFYNESGAFLFEIPEIKKPLLIVDKVNFFRTGWYNFKLYRDSKIYEEWRFRISETGD